MRFIDNSGFILASIGGDTASGSRNARPLSSTVVSSRQAPQAQLQK
jgi:hypothetical protein